MDVDLLELEPKILWKHFDAIRQIPRESGNEKAAGDYVISIAQKNNLDYNRDEAGNIVVRVPATPGHESAQTVVLQGHMDMVCEKNADVSFDFAKDPIQVWREGEWLYAKGTTLGADNGIGIAAALAIAEDDSVVHGPLELLFTADEETGLIGASKIKPDFLEGKKYLNLDSEDEGIFIVGCAGGRDTRYMINFKKESPPFNKAIRITINGLKGGHSGLDIHKNRGNAIKYMVRPLWAAMDKHTFRIAHINGGNKRNAIPREIVTDLVVSEQELSDFKALIKNIFDQVYFEYKSVETDAKLDITELNTVPEQVMDEEAQQTLLNLLYAVPHGVLKMSADIPDLVETSTNLATVQLNGDQVEVGCSSRSSMNSALQATANQLLAIGHLANVTVDQPEGYPGWAPNLDSEVLSVVQSTYKKLHNKEPEVEAIHAGLECGIIGEKFPGMDMVSFGPQIENPHSPDERVHLKSVENFWHLLKAALEELA